jgi:TPR repeat protein
MSENEYRSYQEAITLIQDWDYEGAVSVLLRIGGSETEAWEEVAGTLYSGIDVTKRPDDAIAIWRRFAEGGSAHSQQVLGAVLVRRDDPESILEGIEWLEKAGDQGKSYALVNLAQIYYAGHGPIPANPKRCTDYFHLAVELGDTEAMVTLAHYYKVGFGVAQSNHEYLRLNKLAADSGHPGAHFNLGINYEYGYLCPVNDELAFKHYFIAAEAGFAQAQHNLGARFFNGKGVTQNKRQGIAWYIQAAANDSELSMHCLGLAFLNGDGVDRDPVRALGMFAAAQQHGSTESSPFIEKLNGTLNVQEISDAMEFSRDFKSIFQKAIDSTTPPMEH